MFGWWPTRQRSQPHPQASQIGCLGVLPGLDSFSWEPTKQAACLFLSEVLELDLLSVLIMLFEVERHNFGKLLIDQMVNDGICITSCNIDKEGIYMGSWWNESWFHSVLFTLVSLYEI
jgi:hypothetical protein